MNLIQHLPLPEQIGLAFLALQIAFWALVIAAYRSV